MGTPMTPPRTPSASAVEATHLVMPGDTNMLGTAFGGKIMQWMDIAASVAAGRHSGGASVTVAVDDLHFARPIRMGDVVILKACVNFTGRTSMEVGVRVMREDRRTRQLEHCLSGYFTFVGVDDAGRPMAVPGIVARTDLEHKRYAAAAERQLRRVSGRPVRSSAEPASADDNAKCSK
ncbi:MAG: acyl-CoA thioesterase [Deltaproteobacteria bacterium]|nr:MAG: acyl-CoA thioesterase [Deltaproteobacteria bacterium]